MTASRLDNEAIFHAARDVPDPDRRRDFVWEACDGDETRIAHVEAMLAAADAPDSLLDCPAGRPSLATIDQPPAERPGAVIGPYKLLQQIGEGGMGVVWMAEQTQPVQRKVALKVIKPGMDSRQVIARFEAERQALAMMDHVNIARVFDGGTTEAGRPYFVMELVHGVPITKYCDDNHLTPRERLELFVPVCQAIQHAHQKGIIHRDMKPSNVMATLYDGKSVPKVIDFGVAKATEQKLTERTLFTQYGTMVGTLEYMSPEQAETSALGVDTRSDIYSLGVLLYELLTGSTPLTHKRMKEAAYAEILRMIKEEEPPRPSTRLSDSGEALASISANRQTEPAKLTKLVKGELDWIVMKCLEKDRNRRYETANAFAADVQRYLADEPVQACPPSAGYRLRKFVRRHRVGLAMAGTIATLLVFAVAMLTFANVRVNEALIEKSDALAEKTKALGDLSVAQQETLTANASLKNTFAALTDEQSKTRLALDQERLALYSFRIALAYREWEAGRVGRAEFLLDECPPPLRDWEWHYLKRQCHLELVSFSSWSISQKATWLGDGSRVAVSDPSSVRVWHAKDGRRQIRHASAYSRPVFHTAISRQEQFAESDGKTVFIKDLISGKETSRIPVEDGQVVWIHEFSPDGEKLVWLVHPKGKGQQDFFFQIYDVARNKALFRVPTGGHANPRCGFVESGKSLVHNQGAELILRDATSGQEQGRWRHDSPGRTLGDLATSPTDHHVATLTTSGYLAVWDTRAQKLVWDAQMESSPVTAMAFHPGGPFLGTGHRDGTIRIWQLQTGQKWLVIRGHDDPVSCLAFRADGQRLLSGSRDGKGKIWNTTALSERTTPGVLVYRTPGSARYEEFSLSLDGRFLAVGTFGSINKETLIMWDTATGTRSLVATNLLVPMVLSPDGQRVAGQISGTPRGVYVIDCKTGKKLLACGDLGIVRDLAFSPDGRLLAAASEGEAIRLWDTTTGEESKSLTAMQSKRLAFSPDGTRLAARIQDAVFVWDVKTWEVVWSARETAPCHAIAFSRDNLRVALASQETQDRTPDWTVRILDAKTGTEQSKIKGLGSEVSELDFHPNGKRLATVTSAGALVIWDLEVGRETLALQGGAKVLFSPDGHLLYVAARVASKGIEVLDARPWLEQKPAR